MLTSCDRSISVFWTALRPHIALLNFELYIFCKSACCIILNPGFVVYSQVAERALFLWNNDHIVSLVAQNRQVVLPLIFSALERNTRSHWNQAVHGLTLNVRKMFLEMDQDLFQECQRKFQEDEAKAKDLEEKRESTWTRLEAAATSRPLSSEAMLGSQGLNNNLAYGNRAMVGS